MQQNLEVAQSEEQHTIDTSSSQAQDREDAREVQKWRVKVYELSPSSTWEDLGTGFIDIEQSRDQLGGTWNMLVRSEIDNSIILLTKIIKNDVYQLQQDTLIVWTEVDGRDLSLSFQDAQGCDEIWNIICEVQKHISEKHPNHDDAFSHDEFMILEGNERAGPLEIPAVDIGNMGTVEHFVEEMRSTVADREILIRIILTTSFMKDLFDAFQTAEDLEMQPELRCIFNITRNILCLNDNQIWDLILKEENFIQVCSIFEYDNEYPIPIGKHRSFLKENRFRSVGKFRSPEIELKIHQIFRAQYLRDVVLARIIDDPAFSKLHSIIMFNQVEVLNSLPDDHVLMPAICAELKDPTVPLEKQKLNLQFIQDFCTMSRSLMMVRRHDFYLSLCGSGFLDDCQKFLLCPDTSIRMIVTEILAHMLEHDASLVRGFIMTQRKHKTTNLSEVVIKSFIEELDVGLKYQCFEILKILLDWSATQTDRDYLENSDFINFFFSDQIQLVVAPFSMFKLTSYHLTSNNIEKEILELSDSQVAFCQLTTDLVMFLIKLHPGKTKSFLLRDFFLEKMTLLLKSKHGYVKLFPIRLLRCVIAANDEFYHRGIVKKDLFAGVMSAFETNGLRYNMLNSAVLELLDFICNTKIITLIKYILTNFREILVKMESLPSIKKFLETGAAVIRTDSSETTTVGLITKSVPPIKSAWSSIDRDEEDYFSEQSLPEETTGASVLTTDEPPIPKRRSSDGNGLDDDDEDDFLSKKNLKSMPKARTLLPSSLLSRKTPTALISTKKSPTLSSPTSPKVISPRSLVDYGNDEETQPVESSSPRRMTMSPRGRNVILGSKRVALDEADPRDWDREMVMDIGPLRTGSPPIPSGLAASLSPQKSSFVMRDRSPSPTRPLPPSLLSTSPPKAFVSNSGTNSNTASKASATHEESR